MKKHLHFLQIVLENKIWCAKPDSLNDPDEFKFKLDYQPTSRTADLLSKVMAKYRTTNFPPPHISASIALQNGSLEENASRIIGDIVDRCRGTIGITSFSAIKSDDRLWSEYGGKGNGVCIEIDIPESLYGHFYHPVRYVPEKVFHVDSFFEADLFHEKIFPIYQDILLTKTQKWSEEQEIRFIGKYQEVNFKFDGHVREVTFGSKVSRLILDQLLASIGNHCRADNIRIVML